MANQDSLEKLGVRGESIWGDDLETTVFALVRHEQKAVIFRFELEKAKKKSESVVTRVVNCYHGIEVGNNSFSFPDRYSMRTAIWEAIANVWTQCENTASIADPDAIINIWQEGSNEASILCWELCHDKLYKDYLDLLRPLSRLSLRPDFPVVEFRSLTHIETLEARTSASVVLTDPDSQTRMVYKGIDFATFLHTYESGLAQEEAKTFYRSVELISNMARHQNILPPPKALVTVRNPGDESSPLICGTLYPYYSNGDLGSYIEKSKENDQLIPLELSAGWCKQMTAAVYHTHRVARTYHMDIKPKNFLLDDNLNLLLIDWEQIDAPMTTAAPEIDGTWDVEQSADASGSISKPIYKKYTGPERRNMPECTPGVDGWNTWNVFPIWIEECPKAAELAEVFSLGRTMWILLRRPDLDDFEELDHSAEIVEDWEGCDKIPEIWKTIVQACVNRDPNDRPDLEALLAFWTGITNGTAE